MTDQNVEPEDVVRDYFLSSKAYDIIKWLAQIVFPALGTLYFGLAQYWGLPNADKVVGTIMVIDTFLGVLLGFAAKSYNNSDTRYDGSIDVEDKADGGKHFSLVLNGDPNDLDSQSQVLFKVNPR